MKINELPDGCKLSTCKGTTMSKLMELSADQAERITRLNKKQLDIKLKTNIQDMIKAAASDGKSMISYKIKAEKCVVKQIISYLKSLGYYLDFNNKNKHVMSILWGEAAAKQKAHDEAAKLAFDGPGKKKNIKLDFNGV